MKTTNLLSKSDFKLASTCATKLYYKKMGYPQREEGNEYLEFLRDGGFIVGKLAQLLEPDGVLIDKSRGALSAVEETKKYLNKDTITLFEAAFQHDGKLVIVDIFRKQGNYVELVEVKSKSFDSRENDYKLKETGLNLFHSSRGGFISEWCAYLEDIAYQTWVVRLCLPDCSVSPRLLVPDKSKSTTIDKLASYFSIDDRSKYDPEVTFSGDLEELRQDDILVEVPVDADVEELLPEISKRAASFLSYLRPELRKAAPKLCFKCRDCEFAAEGQEKNGFRECWGDKADTKPHILGLYKGGKLALSNELIADGKSSLYDLPLETLTGAEGERRRIQITYTAAGKEFCGPDLAGIIDSVSYPLHFVDFETSRVAVPYHKGMRPYEQVAFQWSCHTVNAPGSKPEHSEWINLEELFPNIEFAKTLKNQLGDSGTVLTWSHHERSVLRDIRKQIRKYKYDEPQLDAWLLEITHKPKDDFDEWELYELGDDYREAPRHKRIGILDLEKVTVKQYFHPEMGGRTSIKKVLPAIWNNNPSLHERPEFRDYVRHIDGVVQDPYKALEPINLEGVEFAVREGTAAMLAYQDLLYGRGRGNAENKRKLKEALLQYCALDTLSMVVIWEYWRERISTRSTNLTGGRNDGSL